MSPPTSPPEPEHHTTKPIGANKRDELLAIRRLRDSKGLALSNTDLFRHVGVSHSTGYRIFKKPPRDPNAPENRGRSHILSTEQVNQLLAFLRTDGQEECTLPWDDLGVAAGLVFPNQRPSKWTLKRCLDKHGWRKCGVCKKFWIDYDTAACREAFANEFFARETLARETLAPHGLDRPFWRRIRYSDEVHFKYGSEGKVTIVRMSGERYNTDCIRSAQKPPEDNEICLSAWAAIGWNFKSRLIWYYVTNNSGAMTLQAYRDQILEPEVKRWILEGHDFILEEDGSWGHGGNSDHNIVKQWKQYYGLQYFFNCPAAPALAPIENAWRAPKGQVKRQAVRDAEALRLAAEEAWAKLPQDAINKWVEEVPGRLTSVSKKR